MDSQNHKFDFSTILNGLICPVDQNKLVDLSCPKCGTNYTKIGRIHCLLPDIKDKGKQQEKKRYDLLGRSRNLEDLDPIGRLYPRKIMMNNLRVSSVIKSAHINKNQLVLDVGCGSGHPSLAIIREKKVKVVGLDLSSGALEFFEEMAIGKRLENRVLLFQGDAENLPFDANLFDRVISFSSLEHVPHPDKFIEECVRVCKFGGYVSACTPNKMADPLRRLKPGVLKLTSIYSKKPLTKSIDQKTEKIPPSPYHKEFIDKDLKILFENKGLESVSTSYLIYLPTGIPRPIGSILSKRPIIYFEDIISKIPLFRRFSSLLIVTGRKKE